MKVRATIGLCVLACLIGAADAQASSLGHGVTVQRSAETGAVSAIGTDPGVTIPAPSSLPDSAGLRRTALAYADAYGPRFGVAGGSDELSVSAVEPSLDGGRTVRLQQEIAGVPVIGGELQVNLDGDGELRSMTGEAEPDAPATEEPNVSAGEAAATAIAAVSKAHGIELKHLQATTPELSILDSRIMGGPGADGPQLVWKLEVGDDATVQSVRDFVAVDAGVGAIAVQFPEIEAALDRSVCDAANVPDTRVPCAAPFARTEGGAATGIPDVDLAYQYAGDTYALYALLGRDSLDDAGLPLKSTVKYCPPPPDPGDPPNCPFQNAFWNGEQMVYGDGFASADDVVGHELTHGFTEFSSHLFYYYQSGAINESLSDVFGEFVDLSNSGGPNPGTDTPAVRWLIGEDLPSIGAIRNMANPPEFGDPDKTSSSEYDFEPNTDFNIGDNGGVHGNSGVNNKAAFLISDGGSFNGQTVTGLGIPKAELLYYRVDAALLGSASDYQDLGIALRQACSDLVTAGTGGFTSADCTEVDKAVLATEMDTPPARAPASTHVAACEEPGDTAPSLYTDNFENEAEVTAGWAPSAAIGTSEWYYPPENNPYFDATYAKSGTENLWGLDQPDISDTTVEMLKDVRIPLGDGRLRFNHAFGFDSFDDEKYDGGLLEYSTDGGSTFKDAGSLITSNGYTGTILAASDNPLAGRVMWTGESAGYRTVKADLTSLAGKVVRFRFRMATDSSVADYGWFIDDFQIYRCANHVPPTTKIKKAPTKVKTKRGKAKVKVTFGGSDDTTPSNKLGFQCKLDRGKFKTCKSRAKFKVKAKPGKGKKHTLQVRALDYSANPDPTPAKVSFKAIKRSKK